MLQPQNENFFRKSMLSYPTTYRFGDILVDKADTGIPKIRKPA